MEFEVFVLSALLVTVGGIIVNPGPLTYTVAGGYASQYAFPSTFITQEPNILYKYGNPKEIPYVKSPQQSKYSTGSQYAAGYPTVHHPAEFTFASPPVRHAEPINFPVPPAPVQEDVKEPPPQQLTLYDTNVASYPEGTITYTSSGVPQSSLLGVAYSSASDVSRMTFSNGHGVSYGY